MRSPPLSAMRRPQVMIREYAYDYYSGEDLQVLSDKFGPSIRWFSKLLKRRKYPIRPKNFSRYGHIRERWLKLPQIKLLRERFGSN